MQQQCPERVAHDIMSEQAAAAFRTFTLPAQPHGTVLLPMAGSSGAAADVSSDAGGAAAAGLSLPPLHFYHPSQLASRGEALLQPAGGTTFPAAVMAEQPQGDPTFAPWMVGFGVAFRKV
jgi:hypothetical protein